MIRDTRMPPPAGSSRPARNTSTPLTPGGPGQSTHRVALTGADEVDGGVDGEVEALLRAAYEQNA
ncbi:hypothetical protein GCM10010492_25520 [Saccharothrix mutabilis subsp. mutabilis]|uniref:Uncharacterized protein n=2 Tax=Saccharothrix mutabilis TaxID=33921 RepID=A0ABN0TNG8_9PSEU